jgi:outer membrane protein assembly factor BamB
MDAQGLPNGNVLIAEADAHRVTERNLKGVVKWEKKIDGEPNGCQRLANGNIFVSTPGALMEYTPDGIKAPGDKTVYWFELGIGGSNAARRGRDGNFYCTLSNSIGEHNTSGKIIRIIELPLSRRGTPYMCVQDLPGDRFLVAEIRGGRVLEVDAAGRLLWEAAVPSACGAERLPNGHTLVATNHKVIELDADGQQVWTKDAEGFVRRSYRR